jgi:hypothetical protein
MPSGKEIRIERAPLGLDPHHWRGEKKLLALFSKVYVTLRVTVTVTATATATAIATIRLSLLLVSRFVRFVLLV